jgi:hypothetical protein
MKTDLLCFTQFEFTAWSRKTNPPAGFWPICEGEQRRLPAGTPCRIIARTTADRVLLELDPMGRPAYGWGNVIDIL